MDDTGNSHVNRLLKKYKIDNFPYRILSESDQPIENVPYIFELNGHAYVMIETNNYLLVGDGMNYCFNGDISCQLKELKWFNHCKHLYVKFEQQTNDNACASSAAVIAFELIKMYQKNKFSRVISANANALNLARDVTNQNSGVGRLNKPIHLTKPKYNCEHCDKKFKNKLALNNHSRACLAFQASGML